jgi:hypothetical protein
MPRTFQTSACWHTACTSCLGGVHLSTGVRHMKAVLIVSALVSGLLGTVATASGGSQIINIGGINKYSSGEGQTGSSTSRLIDKSLTGGGGAATIDLNRLREPATSGGGFIHSDPNRLRDQFPTGRGGSTIPSANGTFQTEPKAGGDPTTQGTFQTEPGTGGQSSAPSCSSRDVTIGEETYSTVHCPNSVGGTLR